jgi:hypothetical protein
VQLARRVARLPPPRNPGDAATADVPPVSRTADASGNSSLVAGNRQTCRCDTSILVEVAHIPPLAEETVHHRFGLKCCEAAGQRPPAAALCWFR